MNEVELITIGNDFFENGGDWDEFVKLRMENKIIDALKLGNVGEILAFLIELGKRQKKLIDKNSRLEYENELLKDQIRKHACFEVCEKRLQKHEV